MLPAQVLLARARAQRPVVRRHDPVAVVGCEAGAAALEHATERRVEGLSNSGRDPGRRNVVSGYGWNDVGRSQRYSRS